MPTTDATDPTPPRQPDPTAERIAAALGETDAQPLRGGMLLPDGSRRTKGGVFFRLAREQASPQERTRIWPWTRGPKPPAAKPRPGGGRAPTTRGGGRPPGR